MPFLFSIEAIGICMPIENSEVLFTGVQESLSQAFHDADNIEPYAFYISRHWKEM
jgi:hypothetical protein